MRVLKDRALPPVGSENYFSFLDAIFPQCLNHLYDPPCGLYYLGDLQLLHHRGPWIGVVGTRYASQYAFKACEQIVMGLKPFDPVIVSGMAIGVDGKAHESALEFGIKTVGVLGTPLDQIYPPDHEDLFFRMRQQGLLLSEMPSGSELGPWNFPKRNRIIAGLVDTIIVVEAPEKSGALITAKFALDLGKEIYVVPGPIDSIKNLGGHRLIQEGANLLIDPKEIMVRRGLATQESSKVSAKIPQRDPGNELNAEQTKIFHLLKKGPQHIDNLVDLGQLPAPQISSLLMELCLKGWVQELPGKVFEIA